MRNRRIVASVLLLTGLAALLFGQACSRPEATDPQAGVLEAGRRAFLSGEYPRAEEIYQYYLQAFPHGAFRLEAWQRLADISQDVFDAPAKAAPLLEAALLEYDHDPENGPEILDRAAGLRQRLGQYDKAADLYGSLLSLPGLSPARRSNACRQLAQVRILAHDLAGALAVYRSCRARLPDGNDRARCDIGQAALLLRLEEAAQAEAVLEDVFKDRDVTPAVRAEAGFLLGQHYEAVNDKAKARTIYENIRDTFPNPLVVDQRLGYLRP